MRSVVLWMYAVMAWLLWVFTFELLHYQLWGQASVTGVTGLLITRVFFQLVYWWKGDGRKAR